MVETHDQNRALEFGDLGDRMIKEQQPLPTQLPVDQQDLVTLQQRSEFLFSGISDMNDKMRGGKLVDDSAEMMDELELPNKVHSNNSRVQESNQKADEPSFPPPIT